MLAEAGVAAADLHSVEMVGGGARSHSITILVYYYIYLILISTNI